LIYLIIGILAIQQTHKKEKESVIICLTASDFVFYFISFSVSLKNTSKHIDSFDLGLSLCKIFHTLLKLNVYPSRQILYGGKPQTPLMSG